MRRGGESACGRTRRERVREQLYKSARADARTRVWTCMRKAVSVCVCACGRLQTSSLQKMHTAHPALPRRPLQTHSRSQRQSHAEVVRYDAAYACDAYTHQSPEHWWEPWALTHHPQSDSAPVSRRRVLSLNRLGPVTTCHTGTNNLTGLWGLGKLTARSCVQHQHVLRWTTTACLFWWAASHV